MIKHFLKVLVIIKGIKIALSQNFSNCDFPGNDFQILNASDKDACFKFCFDLTNCSHYSFDTTGGRKLCSLKNAYVTSSNVLINNSTLGINCGIISQISTTSITTMTTTRVTTTTTAPSTCDLGWLFWGGHCYKVFNQYHYNGLAAKYSCISQDAYLVKIDSDPENAFLTSLMNSVAHTNNVTVCN